MLTSAAVISMMRLVGICRASGCMTAGLLPPVFGRSEDDASCGSFFLAHRARRGGGVIGPELVIGRSNRGMKFTNQTKKKLIQRLIVATEQRQVSWPAAWEILTNELKRYEYAVTANGTITYNAPSGFHDDCVIALALANKARHRFAHS